MEKKVFCAILGRCKCIKFVSSAANFDKKIVVNKLLEICKRDLKLFALIKDKDLILQRKDIDAEVFVDIEDDEDIYNLEKIKVLPLSRNLISSYSIFDLERISTVESQRNIDVLKAPLEIQEINQDIDIIKIENMFDEVQKCTKQPNTPLEIYEIKDDININDMHDDVQKSIQLPNAPLEIQEVNANIDVDNMLDDNYEFSGFDTFNSQSYKLQEYELPKLPIDIMRKIQDYGVLAASTNIIRFWGSYLWEKTKTKPTVKDYGELAMKITLQFPELRGGYDGIGIVRKQLSAWVRNHRINLKTRATKRDRVGKIVPSRQLTESNKSSRMDDADAQRALEELKRHSVKNTPQIKKLLKLTLPQRRDWISKEPRSMAEIIELYPQLKEHDLVLYEFCCMKQTSVNNLNANVQIMFNKLMQFYETYQTQNMERSKYEIMMKLNSDLSKKKWRNTKPLLILKQVNSSTDDSSTDNISTCVLGESPRAIIYMVEDRIAEAYIVADSNIQLKIKFPTMEKVIICLLATYYVWNTKFPSHYKYILEYIDNALLGTPVESNFFISKFIRNRDIVLKNKLNDNT